MRSLQLRLYCKVCKVEQLVFEGDYLNKEIPKCGCCRILRPALSNGETDWNTVGRIQAEIYATNKEWKECLIFEVKRDGYAIREAYRMSSDTKQKLYFMECPHPDCWALLNFTVFELADKLETRCICHGCTVAVEMRGSEPKIRLKQKRSQ